MLNASNSSLDAFYTRLDRRARPHELLPGDEASKSNLTQVPRSEGLCQAGASAPREAKRLASRVASGPLSRGFELASKRPGRCLVTGDQTWEQAWVGPGPRPKKRRPPRSSSASVFYGFLPRSLSRPWIQGSARDTEIYKDHTKHCVSPVKHPSFYNSTSPDTPYLLVLAQQQSQLPHLPTLLPMTQLLNNQPQPNSQPPSVATPKAQPLLDPSLVSPSEISVLQTPDSSDITVVQHQQPTQPTITVLGILGSFQEMIN
ncbi:hypothetical protein PGT21_026824 [Puccinia graminis f. sp. tritici]|uniref:Uncharacterized protein n=1 Tax=Puccinia graminis f. sp. tritici TaxID=56615 RepID=A0A5B0LX30_PUCGR|nr:hypothetical protein PGTUg99_011163 [Puccinia graminis f. sp. tritici]KAA1104559.1 hypothetical protein PGT21_026824 [Puccinia graminis f. sp. tritici]